MPLPPGVLMQDLAGTFPQFTLCDAALNQALHDDLDPTSNPDASQFVQWLQDNPAAAKAAADILNPPGTPQTSPAPLDPSLVQALLPLLISTARWIVDQPAFAGVAWTIQQSAAPGPETPQPAGPGWTLTSQAPIGGLEFPSIVFAGGDAPAFTLTLVNDQPRHLSAYARFSKAGVPVAPSGWSSRLPVGVPVGFESATDKYLGMLLPGASVAGIAVDGAAQSITVPLPANADAVHLMFGGLNGASYSPIPDAAGIILTVVLDMIVPWIVQNSQADPADLASWFGGVIGSAAIRNAVLSSGAFLLQANRRDAMFAALSANLCQAMLGSPLAPLRKSIAKELGDPPNQSYSWVDQFAPAAGWPAQMIQAVLAGGLNPQYWPGATPAITLDLAPATTIALALSLLPDPVSASWPYTAVRYSVTIRYAGGYSQTLSGAVPPPQASAPLMLAFGSVATAGPIAITAEIRDAANAVVATGAARVDAGSITDRTVVAALAMVDIPATIDATTRYARAARLTVQAGRYVWDATAPPSTAVAPVPPLTSLNVLTLQGDAHALGYAWGASNQSVTVCGGSAPLSNAYFVQNIGTAEPAAQYRALGCGLVSPPLLAYAAAGRDGFYLDTQGTGAAYLRPVAFGAGPFDPSGTRSSAQFPAQSALTGIAVATAVAAISRDRGTIATGACAPAPVDDAQAPCALSHGGAGGRVGLLGAPVAVAATADGAFLVLEQANARVQAFDANGNPIALFAGQPTFALQAAAQPVYRDLAVSPRGLIYVLGSQNGGATPADFFLDIYDADGAALSRTSGVNAARIAVAADDSVYTLDFDAMTGLSGRAEPVLSVWHPTG